MCHPAAHTLSESANGLISPFFKTKHLHRGFSLSLHTSECNDHLWAPCVGSKELRRRAGSLTCLDQGFVTGYGQVGKFRYRSDYRFFQAIQGSDSGRENAGMLEWRQGKGWLLTLFKPGEQQDLGSLSEAIFYRTSVCSRNLSLLFTSF